MAPSIDPPANDSPKQAAASKQVTDPPRPRQTIFRGLHFHHAVLLATLALFVLTVGWLLYSSGIATALKTGIGAALGLGWLVDAVIRWSGSRLRLIRSFKTLMRASSGAFVLSAVLLYGSSLAMRLNHARQPHQVRLDCEGMEGTDSPTVTVQDERFGGDDAIDWKCGSTVWLAAHPRFRAQCPDKYSCPDEQTLYASFTTRPSADAFVLRAYPALACTWEPRPARSPNQAKARVTVTAKNLSYFDKVRLKSTIQDLRPSRVKSFTVNGSQRVDQDAMPRLSIWNGVERRMRFIRSHEDNLPVSVSFDVVAPQIDKDPLALEDFGVCLKVGAR